MDDQSFTYLNGNTIELHYWLKNQSHSMDAFVQNKCEHELLLILKEIANKFNPNILIETEAFGEGGLRRWFNIISGIENKNASITIAFITAFAIGITVTPVATGLSEIAKKFVDHLFEDNELKSLLKEKTEIEIQNLKLDAEIKLQQLSQNKSIIKRKSNFYLGLKGYLNTDKVTFSLEDKTKKSIKEIDVHRNNFDDYIIFSDELEPEIDENAVIEIISPILKKGNYKWRGIYNGKVLSFNMKIK